MDVPIGSFGHAFRRRWHKVLMEHYRLQADCLSLQCFNFSKLILLTKLNYFRKKFVT